MPSNKRIYILPDAEVKEVYDYPVFSDTERQEYLFLEKKELAFLRKFKRVNAKVYFILQLGYFKSTTIFHKICFKKSRKDIAYIRKTYFPESQIPTILPSSKVKKKTREITCQLLKIKLKVNCESLLMKKASSLIKNNVDPIDLFRELLIYLEQNSIPIPAYSTMQTIIGKAITAEEKRLNDYLDLLDKSFNLWTLPHIMCRSLISVDYRGFIYDCDFNQALGLGFKDGEGHPLHISSISAGDLAGRKIMTDTHCFSCTAGSGSSCGGALT